MTSPDFSTVSLVTGFLGSGKTTLMRELLRDPALKDAAVIVNEFGEIGLDHQLMESNSQKPVLLESGCICCTLDGSLVETLENLHRQRRSGTVPPFRNVLIETTGLAEPAPIIHELFDSRAVRLGFTLNRVITLVDAVNGWTTLDRHEVAVRQAALADTILVSKTDLAPTDAVERLMSRISVINPIARLLRVEKGQSNNEALWHRLDDPIVGEMTGWSELSHRAMRPSHDGHSAHHDHDRIATAAVRLTTPISLAPFSAWLEQAIAAYGDDLLRIKGILNIEGRTRPVVIHGVQRVFHPPVELNAWPDSDRTSRLILILHDIEPNGLIRSLRQALASRE